MRLGDLREVFRMALAVLTRSPGRSALTILGLAIGIGSYIAMTSFGQGAKRSVVDQFTGLGTNIVRIQTLYGDPAAGPRAAQKLTYADVEALRRDVTAARAIVPSARFKTPVTVGGVSVPTVIVGTTPEYAPLHLWSTSEGGGFDAGDMARRAKVCVIGATPARVLFGDGSPLGRKIAIGDRLTCHVIGVLAGKGLSTSGRDLDDFVLVPLTTFEAYVGLPNGFADIELEADDPRVMPALRAEASAVIRSTHQIPPNANDDVRITSPTEAVRTAESVSTILTRLLAAIAAVSLLVGGIGIMNIQLVAVAERTREIGTRAAIGATPEQILVQFLAESLVLSLVGSVVGMAAGLVVAFAVANAMGWPRAIDPVGVAGAALFGVCAGLLFGYLPAKRAAELEPIEALRHE